MTSTSTRTSSAGLRISRSSIERGNGSYVPPDCVRLEGPALPPHGRPDVSPSLEKLNERLERLAFGRRPEGHDAPPLETYTTTATEHGDVVRATSEYVGWFRRAYPAAGPENRVSQQAPGPAPEGVGGKALDRFKAP